MFPDIASVLHIREALWRHKEMGCASIMIGAGFSRNASARSPSARTMPTWTEMARALCEPLYGADENRLKAALRDANGISGFLGLAQEYQIAFGVSALNDRIRGLVPDTDYDPGDLHARLLRLPWADVFSTNWDTLLERTCSEVFNRSYDIVRTAAEIPFTVRPRIVKLHGSFPAYEPFIFTEEEYRTYPTRFSPFVNLVQQSMMETIFCLLGFSGDDPNFLHWAGWVRDNLGVGAPKIYLVNWLELSQHRRRMLEARNVMPVDLSALPEARSWPPELRHQYATEWFIAAMELGRPYDPLRWPRPPSPRASLPPHLISVPLNTAPLPVEEPTPPPEDPPASVPVGQDPIKDDQVAALQSIARIWAHNRKLYPGWLVAPATIREHLFRHTGMWLPLLYSRMDSVPALTRLQIISEVAWRLQRALIPLTAELEAPSYAILDTIDQDGRTIDGCALTPAENWSEAMKCAGVLALALARNARHVGKRAEFDKALSLLRVRSLHDDEARNAVVYEECLWDLACGELMSLQARLQDWLPAPNATVWRLRKAGLLAELQEAPRALDLIESTLAQIRRSRRRDRDDLASLSLEAWALFLVVSDWQRRGLTSVQPPPDFPPPFERWRALAIVNCDAGSEYEDLKRKIDVNYRRPGPFAKRKGFDLDHFGSTTNLSFGPPESVIAAYQMVLLAEVTGLPPSTNHFELISGGLKAAATLLFTEEA